MMDETEVEKEFESNVSALKTWFQLDENAIPPVYQLQSIRSDYSVYLHQFQKHDNGKELKFCQWKGV